MQIVFDSLDFEKFKRTEPLPPLNIDFQINTCTIALVAGAAISIKFNLL